MDKEKTKGKNWNGRKHDIKATKKTCRNGTQYVQLKYSFALFYRII